MRAWSGRRHTRRRSGDRGGRRSRTGRGGDRVHVVARAAGSRAPIARVVDAREQARAVGRGVEANESVMAAAGIAPGDRVAVGEPECEPRRASRGHTGTSAPRVVVGQRGERHVQSPTSCSRRSSPAFRTRADDPWRGRTRSPPTRFDDDCFARRPSVACRRAPPTRRPGHPRDDRAVAVATASRARKRGRRIGAEHRPLLAPAGS